MPYYLVAQVSSKFSRSMKDNSYDVMSPISDWKPKLNFLSSYAILLKKAQTCSVVHTDYSIYSHQRRVLCTDSRKDSRKMFFFFAVSPSVRTQRQQLTILVTSWLGIPFEAEKEAGIPWSKEHALRCEVFLRSTCAALISKGVAKVS